MNADVCLLVKTLGATGPASVPLRPCCMTALVALHDRDRPESAWRCPLEEEENDLALAPRPATP